MKVKHTQDIERPKLMEKEVTGIKFELNADYKDIAGQMLDCVTKTRKAIIPVTMTIMDTPFGGKKCTQYLTKKGLKNIELQIYLKSDIPLVNSSCWKDVK